MADSDASVTPEAKLLKLIEETGSSPEQPRQPSKKKLPLKAYLSPSTWKAYAATARENFESYFKRQKGRFQLRDVNRAATMAVIALSCFLVVGVLIEMNALNNDSIFKWDEKQHKRADFGGVKERDFESGLLEEGDLRNIFVPYGKRAEDAKNEKTAVSLLLLDMTKKLKLTGISVNPFDASRTFCMIEDIEKNLTAFLKEGDSISGLKVVKINQDSVIIKYQDEEMELR